MTTCYKTYKDEVLLELISKGDRKAFTTLFHRYWKDMYRSAWYVTQDQAISMDVVQEVFAWFWENRNKWAVTNVRSYLHAAVKYKVANEIRNGKVRSDALEGWKTGVMERQYMTITEELEARELRQVILDFTGELPPRCQEIFRLSRFEHLSNKEIADKLKISEKTVENQITIALRRLRSHLEHTA